jgi:hypothetical protein
VPRPWHSRQNDDTIASSLPPSLLAYYFFLCLDIIDNSNAIEVLGGLFGKGCGCGEWRRGVIESQGSKEMQNRNIERLKKRLNAGLSVYELVQLPGFTDTFNLIEFQVRLRAAFVFFSFYFFIFFLPQHIEEVALAACGPHWQAAWKSADPAATTAAIDCMGQFIGGKLFEKYSMCMGRTNKNRCIDDLERLRKHSEKTLSKFLHQLEESETEKKVRLSCGYFDREKAAGPLSFASWMDCMLPLCQGRAERAADCLQDGTESISNCQREVLALVKCSLHHNDRFIAYEMKQNNRFK